MFLIQSDQERTPRQLPPLDTELATTTVTKTPRKKHRKRRKRHRHPRDYNEQSEKTLSNNDNTVNSAETTEPVKYAEVFPPSEEETSEIPQPEQDFIISLPGK